MHEIGLQSPGDEEFYDVKYIPKEVNQKLGWINDERLPDGADLALPKASNEIRVAIFGDSFSWGDDVEEKYSYPAALERIFLANGFSNIKVLNFGTPGWGFAQAYLLWELVAQKYDLDYILLGPECFQPERDRVFAPFQQPFGMHSRYILTSENDIKRIDIEGDTRYKQFSKYRSFIPDLGLHRFDYNSPPFIQSLLFGRFLKNPFYYQNDDLEIYKIYSRQIENMISHSKGVVLLHARPDILENIKINSLKFRFGEVQNYVQMNHITPYWGGGHYGPLGNLLLAKQYYAALTGTTPTFTKFEYSIHPHKQFQSLKKSDLTLLKDFDIRFGDTSIARLICKFSGNKCATADFIKDMAETKPAGLLFIKGRKQNIINSLIVPMNGVPRDKKVEIVFDYGGSEKKVKIGTVTYVGSDLNVFLFDFNSDNLELKTDSIYATLLKDYFSEIGINIDQPFKKSWLSIGQVKVFEIQRTADEERFLLNPVIGHEYMLASKPDSELNPDKMKSTGSLLLSYTLESGMQKNAYLGTYRLVGTRLNKFFDKSWILQNTKNH